MLAAIALVQLDKLDRHREIRERHFAAYDEAVGRAGRDRAGRRATRATRTPTTSTWSAIDAERAGATRDEYQRALAEENIGTSIHFLPVHLLSAYRDRLSPRQPPLPETERAGAEVLSLPLSPAHSDDDIRDAVDALRRVHERFS